MSYEANYCNRTKYLSKSTLPFAGLAQLMQKYQVGWKFPYFLFYNTLIPVSAWSQWFVRSSRHSEGLNSKPPPPLAIQTYFKIWLNQINYFYYFRNGFQNSGKKRASSTLPTTTTLTTCDFSLKWVETFYDTTVKRTWRHMTFDDVTFKRTFCHMTFDDVTFKWLFSEVSWNFWWHNS
jgi:hypothetical protein